MKTEYDNWDCEGSRRGATKTRRRIGIIVLFAVLIILVAVVLETSGIGTKILNHFGL